MAVLHTVKLKHAVVFIDAANRKVTTHFRDGKTCDGTREDNEMNRREARDEGYPDGENQVWKCLVEHEVAHSFIPEKIWDSPSPALATEAGLAEPQPYWKRLYEESLVICFQRYCNGGPLEAPLIPYADRVEGWCEEFRELLPQVPV